VFVHESAFLQTNGIAVRGRAGVLLVDPGLEEAELSCLADDLEAGGHAVVAGFATHPDWDHVLWHPRLGSGPRYGTARCAAAIREQLSAPGAKAEIVAHLDGTGIADTVPMELLGEITGLPDGTGSVPWDGPEARIVEHRAHADGHAALFLEERGVLLAGDMLSDTLIPMLDIEGGSDPVGEYLAGLRLLEDLAGDVDVAVPGHGSVAGPGELKVRIERDRAYVLALRDGVTPDDPRLGPAVRPGWEWMNDVHTHQARGLAERS
jgi:glyoxylase-like metal-dependent hydrolase (beta-lactamase superfamily II)